MAAALERRPDIEVLPADDGRPVTLFRTDQPDEIIARATETAKALSKVVKRQKLTTAIQGRDHVRVEGWTLLGTMLGVFPVCVWTRKLEDGWEARVEARTLAGQLVGAAEAECLRSERTWATRDDYALRSMAQTRATSKALRQPLGFVMTLAGFDATPAEEMPRDSGPAEESPFRQPPSADKTTASATQVKNIDRLVNKVTKAGIVDAVELAERFQARYGTSIAVEFTKQQASEIIAGLMKLAGETDE